MWSAFTSTSGFPVLRAKPESTRILLAAGEQFAFDVHRRETVAVTILSGRAWLTDDTQDHVLIAGSSAHICRPDAHVVISALADAVVLFERE